MRIIKYLSLVLIAILTVSCEKHELNYMTTPSDGMAEFQLHYFVPVATSTANNIYRVELNDQMIANRKAPLSTFNAIPSGAVGRFYSVAPGTVNIKMYQGSDDAALTKVYDQNVTLSATKQNLFVHDFAQPPVVFDNGYPYPRNTTEITDSTCWIKFYNFLYETAGTPTTLKVQYQYMALNAAGTTTNKWVNIGPPVSFGQSTDWQPVTIIKLATNIVSAGSRTVTFAMKVVDANGNITGDVQIRGSGGSYTNYTGTASLSIGRRYHQIMAGLRAATTSVASVRTFTAL